MRRMTASGLARAEQCIGSVLLPAVDESGGYAATGNAVDRFVQTAKTRGKPEALAEAPADLRPYLDSLTLERIPDGAEYQVGMALHALTGAVRRIPARSNGYRDLGPEWIPGTTDVVGIRRPRAVVIDLKWGSGTIGRDPGDDLQLGHYGVCASTLAGLDEAEVGFSRAGWDGVLRPDTAVLDEMALDAMRARIRAIWERAQSTTPPSLHVGDHCTYCPARRSCPAMVAPAAMMLRGDLADLAAAPPPTYDAIAEKIHALTLEQRGRVYEIADELEARAKLVKSIVRDDARTTPVPLGGGKELRAAMWGTRQSSPLAKAQEAELEEGLRALGEVQTVKVEQVRVMKAPRAALKKAG